MAPWSWSGTLTAAQKTRGITAICNLYGYTATLPSGAANPETPAQFATRIINEWVRGQVRAYEAQQAAASASATASATVDTDFGTI